MLDILPKRIQDPYSTISSVRDPLLTDHFWLNPLSQHFSQICVSDLILVNEEGQVVEGDEPINAAAFAIHSESPTPSLCSLIPMTNSY
jgi:ribulose-5-phosphate 4-epimerase/fuculose-1-phosphate aldolase